MLTLNTKRSAQDSGSLREDERNIIPSKSARAEQSQKTPISRSKLLDISNEMDQNCVDEPVADFTMDIPNMETSTTKTSPTIYHPDSNDPDKLGYEDDDIQEDKIDYLKQENMMNDVENPFWIDPPEQSNHEKEHEEDDGRFQCKKISMTSILPHLSTWRLHESIASSFFLCQIPIMLQKCFIQAHL
jgi:hypothetical protein